MNAPGPTIICAGEDRRNAIADAGGPPGKPNGFDFLEVVPVLGQPPKLALHFIFNVSTAGLNKDNFTIAGGERITTIEVTGVAPHAGDLTTLDLTIDAEGDFSDYVLILHRPNLPDLVPSGFDRQLRTVDFHFHLECAKRFDCKQKHVCPAPLPPPVAINYLAKDYATFRKLMLDRMSLLAPSWTERNIADAGVALIDLMAYAADRLSYRQDAAATEAYLATARLRTSVRRHARLVDYDMHDGTNARAWMHIEVKSDVVGSSVAPAIAPGTRFVTTLAAAPMLLTEDAATFRRIDRSGAQVFESLGPVISLFKDHNQIPLYNWSSTECCLPVGATQATLAGPHPNLRPGDVLMLAEVRGPDTGNEEDADPRKRHPVRLTGVSVGKDPLDGTDITDITWHAEDALSFPLCIAHSVGAEEERVSYTEMSAALGNMVMVDHGRTAGPPVEGDLPETIGTVVAGRRFRPALPKPDLTFAGPNPYDMTDGTLTVSCVAADRVAPTDSLPDRFAITSALTIPDALGGPPIVETQNWPVVRSLFDPALANSPNACVVEVETDGTAYLRFGDGVDGALPDPQSVFKAVGYRIGRMDLGNVGAGTITHAMIKQPASAAAVVSVSNPLSAAGGLAPESIENVRIRAPYAFRTQERAVTLDDYARFAMKCPTVGVLRAVASYRVTRSWRTMLIVVELRDGKLLDDVGEQKLVDWLDIYRMAGVDVEFENARFIPLELEMHVCVDPSYRRAEVQQALLERFSDRRLPDGSLGVFYPDNFTLGDPVYLGPLYAAAQSIAGVLSVDITTFQRADLPGGDGIAKGYLKPGRTEFFTLRNNPDFPERGIFTLTVDGGR